MRDTKTDPYTDEEIETIMEGIRTEIEKSFTDTDRSYIAMVEGIFKECGEIKRSVDMERLGYTNVDEKQYYFPIARADIAQTIEQESWQTTKRLVEAFGGEQHEESPQTVREKCQSEQKSTETVLFSLVGIGRKRWRKGRRFLGGADLRVTGRAAVTVGSYRRKSPGTAWWFHRAEPRRPRHREGSPPERVPPRRAYRTER